MYHHTEKCVQAWCAGKEINETWLKIEFFGGWALLVLLLVLALVYVLKRW